MTDIDRLLSEDGARWRAAQPAAPELDPALFARPRRPRWQPLAAAAAVVVVIAAGIGAAALRRSPDAPPPAAASPGEIVRDGDPVAGQGFVVALPGRPVQLCVPSGGATISIYPPPVPKPCPVAVTVTGLDLGRLSNRHEREGAVWGSARVQGVYRARTLAVTRQEAYREPPRPDASAPDAVPCPEPAGGWTRPPEDMEAAMRRLGQAVNRHAAEYTDLYVRYPYGWHLQDQSNRKGTVVYVVGTTGDVAAARRELERVFPAEHLCVTRASWSKAAMAAAERVLRTPQARAVGIGQPFPDTLKDRVTAELLVLDEAASRFLAGVADGRVIPEPMLEKVR
jgi:hypothetical protein